MTDQQIDEWIEDQVFWFETLGWPPVGISVHLHLEPMTYAIQEFHELHPAQ